MHSDPNLSKKLGIVNTPLISLRENFNLILEINGNVNDGQFGIDNKIDWELHMPLTRQQ